MTLEKVQYKGWRNNVRLSNREVELVVTADAGPRVIRFAFKGKRNVFGEIPAQAGGSGESEWKIRGGHRLWVAPEEKPKTYELDNVPIRTEEIPNGVRTVQEPGPISRVAKSMEITLSPDTNDVTVLHKLTNRSAQPIELAPWSLSVMALKGTAVIPMPATIRHTDRVLPNQRWTLWGYTDLSDSRWKFGKKYLLFRQDPAKGPNKLGIAHAEGWVAYLSGGCLFVKRFPYSPAAAYPDGGMSFETFANEEILELESLGPLVKLAPDESAEHTETWALFKGVPRCRTDADVDAHVLPLVTV